MREVFARGAPGSPVVGGDSRAVPVAAGTMDAVVAAQAFHWFDPVAALAEIARVLRPGGWLALIWNERDESDPMVAELVRISKWDRLPALSGRDGLRGGPRPERPVRTGASAPCSRSSNELDLPPSSNRWPRGATSRSFPESDRGPCSTEVAEFGSTLRPIPSPCPTSRDLFCARSLAGCSGSEPAVRPRPTA